VTALHLGRRGTLPMIHQAEAAECGLACLAMVCGYHGHRIDLGTLRRRHPISLNGVTLRGLIQVASSLKFLCRPLRYEMEHLHELQLPAILHWDMSHFVVLKSVRRKGLVVHDPAVGERTYRLSDAAKHVTGVALELSPTDDFLQRDERARLPLSVFWSHLTGTGRTMVQVFLLSAVLQILVLAAPLYAQLTMDEVIARGDVDLLFVLALGFGLLMLIKTASTAIRSYILLLLQNALHFHLGARLFRHLIRLPASFFEKRHIGDLLSRFSSLQPIRDLIAQGLIAAIIDGTMALITLAMIFFYSPLLALIAVSAFALYAVVRLALYRVIRQRTEATIQAQAQESSIFIENVRAIQSIKLFNRESERETQWLNRYNDVVSANVHLGKAKIGFGTVNDLIFGVESILTLYLAAKLALGNALTVGMIFAYLSYKQHFTDKAVQLVEKALDFRILGLHLERLSDIALTAVERGQYEPIAYTRQIDGRIELRNVYFQYAESELFVLNNINLTIEPGEFVTIMGPSGGGKTTLMKIMLGLLQPTSGEILVDGIALNAIGARVYREQVAAVMQEDQLLSGSIADNICFFEPDFDQSRMVNCAQLAGIHQEVMAMPMTYNSLVGDMGSSLSGGQKQRVLLARALYRQPRILFMDEGTAHLDPENERYVNESLRRLRITRINVAHRPDISAGADRIIRISNTVQAITSGAPTALADARG
jgi:ATP-binding cassette, subfamily B, bacterial CvaB/MchF/RaxB